GRLRSRRVGAERPPHASRPGVRVLRSEIRLDPRAAVRRRAPALRATGSSQVDGIDAVTPRVLYIRQMRRAIFLLLVACKTPPTTSAPPADAAPPLAVVQDAARPLPTVDLLLETEVKITVSSRVDNPRDYPEHLVDGRPETAWNGKTGDLNGWIEVQ